MLCVLVVLLCCMLKCVAEEDKQTSMIDHGLQVQRIIMSLWGGHMLKARPRRCDDETEGVQSKERWAYVKVSMEGVVVGRKVCIFDHAGYDSLARQLEDMFGRHCLSGLRLFEAGSEFSLFYKDTNEHWRTAGDVPWKEFEDCVKRLKIVRKDEALFSSASSLFT